MKRKNYFYGEHFEALGDIWSAIYGNAETFLKDYLEKSIKEGGLGWTLQHKKGLFAILVYPRKKNTILDSISRLFNLGKDYIYILNYILRSEKANTHITTCPVLKGIKNRLRLKEAHTWEFGLEGEFAAETLTANHLILNFYDPFYCIDKKNQFKEEKVCNVYLSAIAYIAQELEECDHTFTEGSYYEYCLEDFLKENPEKTADDFEPVVVKMRAEHFRMYAPKDTTSVIEIAGLIEGIKYIKALGKKFAVLKVNLEHRKDNEYLYVNVYVSEHLLKNYTPKVGKGIVANINLFGYMEQL